MQLWSVWEGSVIRTNSGAGSPSATAASGCSHPPYAPPSREPVDVTSCPWIFSGIRSPAGPRLYVSVDSISHTASPSAATGCRQKSGRLPPPMKTPGGARQGMTGGLCDWPPSDFSPPRGLRITGLYQQINPGCLRCERVAVIGNPVLAAGRHPKQTGKNVCLFLRVFASGRATDATWKDPADSRRTGVGSGVMHRTPNIATSAS